MSEQVVEGNAKSDGCAQGVPDPEKGRPNAGQLLYEAFEAALGEKAGVIISAILGGAEKMNPTCVRAVLHYAELIRSGAAVPEVAYQSLAEVLWNALQVVEAEEVQGGNGLAG